MTQQFNTVSAWACCCVIAIPKLPDRVKAFRKLLDIASHLRALGNFNGVMEILSGLQRQPCFRMERTFQVRQTKQFSSAVLQLSLFIVDQSAAGWSYHVAARPWSSLLLCDD